MITNTAAAVPTSPLPALGDSSDGVTFTMLGASIRLIARATDTDGRFTVFEQTTPSGWGPPRHVHANEDEIVYVLSSWAADWVTAEKTKFEKADDKKDAGADGGSKKPEADDDPHGGIDIPDE